MSPDFDIPLSYSHMPRDCHSSLEIRLLKNKSTIIGTVAKGRGDFLLAVMLRGVFGDAAVARLYKAIGVFRHLGFGCKDIYTEHSIYIYVAGFDSCLLMTVRSSPTVPLVFTII